MERGSSPRDYLALVAPLAAPLPTPGEVRARVVYVRPETHDVTTLGLAPARPFRHRAGQHVGLGVELDGVRRTRTFSVASAEGSAVVELTVKRLPGGRVTPRIVAGELAGAIVTLSEPAGDFVLPEALPARVLLVSGGSGVTPVLSMLRTLAARGEAGRVRFLHWARSAADVAFRAELDGLAALGASVRVLEGPIDVAALDALAPVSEAWEAWACGPPGFLDVVRRARPGVRVESFGGPSAPAPSPEGAADGEPVDVTFARSQRRVRGRGTLLALAEGAGLAPETGCRRGLCGTCHRRKLHGVTRDTRTGAVSHEPGERVPLCVSEPLGPVTVDV